MPDLIGNRMKLQSIITETMRKIVPLYGHSEITTPILEHSAVFASSLGESSDIVSKEMFTFDDRSGNSVTMRPEVCMYVCVYVGRFLYSYQRTHV